MGYLLFPAFIAAGLAQLALGFMGIEYLLGIWAALAALSAAFLFRFMLPLTIGSYFGAVEVMGLPWWGGILVAAPGILFLVPAFLRAMLEERRI